jgi:hypothetical protein
MNLSCKDSGNDALAVAWTFQPTAGATGTKQFYAQGTSDEQVFHCIAVKDGSSGALIPVYADSTLCTLITPNKQTTCLTGENVTPTNNNTVPILPASSSRAAGSVFQCDTSGGPSYVDYTTAASNATDADVIPFPATEAAGASGTGDAFMIGDDAKFNAIRFDRLGCTNGVAGVVAWEYYNGTIWKALPAIRDLTTNFTATLGDFQMVGWTEPADWVTATFNSATRYWVRARCSTLWTTNPTISQVFVGTHGIEYDAIAQVADAGVNPFEGRLGTTPAATGGLFAGANFQWGASKSLGGTAYLISSYIYGVPRDKIDAGLAKNGGVVMALGDTSNRYRVWVVGAADGLGDRADKRNGWCATLIQHDRATHRYVVRPDDSP